MRPEDVLERVVSAPFVDIAFARQRAPSVSGMSVNRYAAVDQHGQIIDILVSPRRDANAARRFFLRALATLKVTPTEVVTVRLLSLRRMPATDTSDQDANDANEVLPGCAGRVRRLDRRGCAATAGRRTRSGLGGPAEHWSDHRGAQTGPPPQHRREGRGDPGRPARRTVAPAGRGERRSVATATPRVGSSHVR
jgi:hypothetical protein